MKPPKTSNPETAPIKVLRKFEKSRELNPGEDQDFIFSFNKRDFELADVNGDFVPEEGVWTIIFDDGNGIGYETIMSFGQ